MNHSLFMRKRFDFCLVDEASQLTLPACIGALRVAQAFILVGDHYQLPPLVRSKEALKGGFGESLFKTLADSHPGAMVKLCNQYRMNDEIMLMANRLTYQNLLKCASEHISAQTLSIARKPLNEVEWIRKVMLPSCKVVFVNTDAMDECHEVKNGNSFHNEIEAKIIEQVNSKNVSVVLLSFVFL
jgi:DNA replication ATP-dependent helicase Dna2